MNEFLSTPIEFLKGVGPNRAELLKKEAGIFTFNDLLHYFPFRYVDRSQYHTVAELPQLDGYAQLKGKIVHVSERLIGKQNRLIAKFQDHTGIIELVWFQGAKWIKPLLKPDVEFQVYGKAKLFGSSFNPSNVQFKNDGQILVIKTNTPAPVTLPKPKNTRSSKLSDFLRLLSNKALVITIYTYNT